MRPVPKRVARELMAKTVINAHRGHIMHILEVLVKLAQRVNIKGVWQK